MDIPIRIGTNTINPMASAENTKNVHTKLTKIVVEITTTVMNNRNIAKGINDANPKIYTPNLNSGLFYTL